MDGFKQHLSTTGYETAYDALFDQIKNSPAFKAYLDIFLRRSYLKHYEELYRKRPTVDEAEVWIGQNHADWGLLVSPRFAKSRWENGKSEIRHFKPVYWSIGHVLETGLVVPDKDERMSFATVKEYLTFFEQVLVRQTASPYQKAIASKYSKLFRAAEDPLRVPFSYRSTDTKAAQPSTSTGWISRSSRRKRWTRWASSYRPGQHMAC